MQPAYAPTTYTGALFPAPLLPALSQMGAASVQPIESEEGKSSDRDELVEVGAVLVLLKLVLG